MRGSDLCFRHSRGDEGWRESARRGGQQRWRLQRSQDLRVWLDDEKLRERVIAAVRDLLDAKLPGTTEPDHEQVALGCLLLFEHFKLGTKWDLIDLLKQTRPELLDEPRSSAFLDVAGAKARLLAALDEGRLDPGAVPRELLAAIR
jgi:hypothetical protein